MDEGHNVFKCRVQHFPL